jgi:DNA helicase-2/ATP-dependent DNA helicase PcrA
VFVVGLEENLFPSERSDNNPKEIEEERRLFYVAITRAEENVVLTYAKNRFRNGESNSCRPSRFLKDIDDKYLRLPGDLAYNRTAARQPSAFEPNVQHTTPGLYTNPRKLSRLEEEKTQTPQQHQRIGHLSVGDTVLHDRFGQGVIAELTGEKENAKATVEFEKCGRRQILLKFAKLEVVK